MLRESGRQAGAQAAAHAAEAQQPSEQRSARRGHLQLAAVQGARHGPRADAGPRPQLQAQLLRQRRLAAGLLARKGGTTRDYPQVIADMDNAARGAVQPQRAQRIDDGADVGVRRHGAEKMVDAFGARHQPDAGLGHDAEVGLAEQTVEERPDTVWEQVDGARVGIMTEAGVEYLATDQHDLHPGDVLQPVAVRRMAEAALEDVADEARVGAGAGAVDLQCDAARAQVVGQLLLGDAGLDHRIRQFRVDQDDAVHARQFEHHLAVGDGAGVAIAPVLAGADRIERALVAARIAVQGGSVVAHMGGADGRAHRPQQRRTAAGAVGACCSS